MIKGCATGPLDQQDLNAHTAFDGVNPSAERVAEHLYKQIAPHLPQAVRLAGVTVTEAEGCRATYFVEGTEARRGVREATERRSDEGG